MKKIYILLFAAAVTLVVMLSGCGLTSGSVFVTQDVEGRAYVDHGGAGVGGRGALDVDDLEHCTVNMTENSDWSDVTIEDFEMMCITCDGQNHLDDLAVSGEVWIVLDTTLTFTNADDIAASSSAYMIFDGLALNPRANGGEGPGTPGFHHFTCEETQTLIHNRAAILQALQQGYFTVWVRADQTRYCFNFNNIVVGSIVVGSI